MADNETTTHHLGPGQFGQRSKSAVVPRRARPRLSTRIDAGMQFGKNNEPPYLAMNPNGRVPTLVDGDYVLWESNSGDALSLHGLRRGFADLSAAPQRARGRRPLARLDAVDAAAGRPAGVLGAGADAGRKARHGRDPEGCRRRSRGNGGSSRRSLRRGASSKAISSRSPISRSAPMRGAGSASRASPSRNCRTSIAGLPQIRRPPRICAVHRAADDVRLSASRWTRRRRRSPRRRFSRRCRLPSILTKPGAVLRAGIGRIDALQRKQLAGCCGLVGLLKAGCCRPARKPRQHHGHDDQEGFSHPAFYRRSPVGARLADELDADRFAAAPDHLAAASGPGVARKRQPQLRRQRVGIVDRDLRSGRGHDLAPRIGARQNRPRA